MKFVCSPTETRSVLDTVHCVYRAQKGKLRLSPLCDGCVEFFVDALCRGTLGWSFMVSEAAAESGRAMCGIVRWQSDGVITVWFLVPIATFCRHSEGLCDERVRHNYELRLRVSSGEHSMDMIMIYALAYDVSHCACTGTVTVMRHYDIRVLRSTCASVGIDGIQFIGMSRKVPPVAVLLAV